MNTFARTKKEWMKEQLETMDVHEHAQVLSIIRKYTTESTKTQNGLLISTDILSDACLEEIEKYVHFLIDQRARMSEDNRVRKSYERMIQ
jgi:hypothetical protein